MKNHLKRILIAAAIIALTPAMVHAQDWDRVKETKDAFSGEKAKQATLGIGYQWAIILKQVGDKYFIGIAINSSGDIRYVIPKGDKIMIKLENEKVIELEMDNDYAPKVNVLGTQIMTSWMTNAEVGIKVIKRLSHSPITAIKIEMQGVSVTVPSIKSKQTSKVMDAAHCILGTTSDQ